VLEGEGWGVGCQCLSPAASLLDKRPGTNYTGGWLDLMAAVDEFRKSPWGLNPGPSRP